MHSGLLHLAVGNHVKKIWFKFLTKDLAFCLNKT